MVNKIIFKSSATVALHSEKERGTRYGVSCLDPASAKAIQGRTLAVAKVCGNGNASRCIPIQQTRLSGKQSPNSVQNAVLSQPLGFFEFMSGSMPSVVNVVSKRCWLWSSSSWWSRRYDEAAKCEDDRKRQMIRTCVQSIPAGSTRICTLFSRRRGSRPPRYGLHFGGAGGTPHNGHLTS